MVATGRPSPGCRNCRKAKKGCDQVRPSCGRCSRLSLACYGYKVSQTAFCGAEGLVPATMFCNVSEDETGDSSVIGFFKKHFRSSRIWLFDQFSDHPLVEPAMKACSLTVMVEAGGKPANKSGSLSLYVTTLEAVRAALGDPQRAVEDATLVATTLLCLFERLNPDVTSLSTDWSIHIGGLIQIVRSRGLRQTQTRQGRAIFREAREWILGDALRREIGPPPFIVLWSQACCHEEAHSMHDQLAVLQARSASFLWKSREHENANSSIQEAVQLERDLVLGRYRF